MDEIPLDFETLPAAEMRRRAEEFRASMARRRSVRAFSDRPVPRQLIERAILTAGSAPSGANRQPWHFVPVSDPEIKRTIRDKAEQVEREFYLGSERNQEWLHDLEPLGTQWQKPCLEVAPWLVAVFEERFSLDAEGRKLKNYYTRQSTGLACGLFIAALHNMGLCTLPYTPAPMGFLSDVLERPPNERPYILFPVGHPAPEVRVPRIERKALSQIATWKQAGG